MHLLVCVAALLACGGTRAAGHDQLVERIDAALAAGARFLLARQSPDGAWRSATYGFMKDGPSLTPLVLSSLFFLPQGGDAVRPAYRRGVDYLVAMVGPDGRVRPGPGGLLFPVYTAAMASRMVVLESRTETHLRAQRAWLDLLCRHRLGRHLGWRPTDPEFGGWGFAMRFPRRPAPGRPKEELVESNLTATAFGLAALRSARVPASAPIYREILAFARRCQNWADDPARRDPRFDDGGFFFIPGDPVQNKAGIAGKDRFGRTRFHSYGTMTADGLRALIRCGLPESHPRVAAARGWLERHFRSDTNPGRFARDREVLRDATYFYYCWAVGHAFSALKVQAVETGAGKVRWAEALADALLSRQDPDGSWANRYTDAKEDDPLIATPWAAAALALCRQALTGEAKVIAPLPGPR